MLKSQKSRENHGENGAQEHRQAQASNRLEKKLGGALRHTVIWRIPTASC